MCNDRFECRGTYVRTYSCALIALNTGWTTSSNCAALGSQAPDLDGTYRITVVSTSPFFVLGAAHTLAVYVRTVVCPCVASFPGNRPRASPFEDAFHFAFEGSDKDYARSTLVRKLVERQANVRRGAECHRQHSFIIIQWDWSR